jgi:hypothetical protein
MRLPTPQQLRDEMKSLVRRAAEPARSGESTKTEIARAARVLGLTYGRAKRYWYGEIQVPPAHEVDAARAAIAGRAGSPAVHAEPAVDVGSGLHVLYDEDGRHWPANSPELRESLGYTVGDFDIGGFAVRCLGWLEIRHAPGRIRLRLAPRIAQPKAIDAACGVLAAATDIEVILVVRTGQTWTEEPAVSSAAAVARIEALVQGPSATGQRFLSVRQPISVLFRDKQHYLVSMLQEARRLTGTDDWNAAIRVAAADETGRTSVAIGTTKAGERAQWRWAHIGSALRFYTAEDRQRLVGTDIRNSPDAEYCEWCIEAYDRAIAVGEPMVEDVRALVQRRAGPPVESRYRRMLVPFADSAGRSIVLVTSDFRPLSQAA